MALWKYSVGLTWSGSGGPGVNVFHFRTTGDPPSTGEISALVEGVHQFYEDISGIFPTSFVAAGPGEIVANFNTSPEFQAVDDWSVTGDSGTGSYLPKASAIVVGWRTAAATRSGRGRTFLGPIAANGLDTDGTPTNAVLTAIRDAAQDLVDVSIGTAGASIGVYSPTDDVLRDWTGFSVRDTFAVLRSRRD